MCETCLYNKNCQFLAKHKLEPVVSCTAYKNAADMVEVVRCKDCNYRDKKGVCERFRQRYPFYPEDDFYCRYGERKA